MLHQFNHSLCILLLAIATLSAGPLIAVDTATIHAGTIEEGKSEVVRRTFTLKNSGDAPLKIENVKPGCSCTSVKYDSLILPGKSGKLTATVNLQGFPGGVISKSVAVLSNAENNPFVNLTIIVQKKAYIDISAPYISINANKPVIDPLYFTSKMATLKVLSVAFTEETIDKASKEWQPGRGLPLQYEWMSTDSTRSDSSRVYKLQLVMPKIDKSCSGSFILTTNHPKKPQIIMPGTLLR